MGSQGPATDPWPLGRDVCFWGLLGRLHGSMPVALQRGWSPSVRPRIAHDRIVCGTSGSSGVLVPAHVAVVNRNASASSSTCRSPEGDALWLHTLRKSLDISGCEPSDKVEVRGCNTQSCCLAQVFRGMSILHSRSRAGNGNGCTDGLWGQWGSWSGAQLLRLCTPSSGPHALRPAMVAPPTASVPGRSRGIKQLLYEESFGAHQGHIVQNASDCGCPASGHAHETGICNFEPAT